MKKITLSWASFPLSCSVSSAASFKVLIENKAESSLQLNVFDERWRRWKKRERKKENKTERNKERTAEDPHSQSKVNPQWVLSYCYSNAYLYASHFPYLIRILLLLSRIHSLGFTHAEVKFGRRCSCTMFSKVGCFSLLFTVPLASPIMNVLRLYRSWTSFHPIHTTSSPPYARHRWGK